MTGHEGGVLTVALAPDGRGAASAGPDGCPAARVRPQIRTTVSTVAACTAAGSPAAWNTAGCHCGSRIPAG